MRAEYRKLARPLSRSTTAQRPARNPAIQKRNLGKRVRGRSDCRKQQAAQAEPIEPVMKSEVRAVALVMRFAAATGFDRSFL